MQLRICHGVLEIHEGSSDSPAQPSAQSIMQPLYHSSQVLYLGPRAPGNSFWWTKLWGHLLPGYISLLQILELSLYHLVSDRGETKSVFREAMRGIVPDEVLDHRDKIGFATPERGWLAAVSPQARDWIGQDLGLEFLNQAEMLRRFDRMMQGRQAFSWQAWRWINFCRWYVRVFDGLLSS